ncbi:hypothetical protein IW261DRAFT_1419962 [Armillaria novae-zelandiae]|uniref:Uncharacterized protein n=1 Tax=Armillaria novae-zelandiae TaxID=153914 RepID=A0AA39TC23_9AGAR|nr:hypothetical protein IW261DRAFT_1419962 [Armillaria novae-zelandiae]
MDDNDPVLPKELLHDITDTVAEDDHAIPTLPAITQTSHAMRLRAQKDIYETIEVDIADNDYINELGHIHATDPMVLAEYPRTLILCKSQNLDRDLADTPILKTIISQMRNLQVVSFRTLNVVGWPFTDSFASPSMAQITNLELKHITLTFHAFNSFISCPCLTELFLARLNVVEYKSVKEGTDFSAPDCSLPQLQSALRCPLKELCLDIVTASNFVIMDLTTTSRYPIIAEDSLIKVNFSSNYSEDNQVHLFQRFFNYKAIKSAKTLHLGDHQKSFTDSDSTGYDPLRFNVFETVELCVFTGQDWFLYQPEFQWWANSLSVVRASSLLKKLRLIITFCEIDVRTLLDMTMNMWDDLDRALCGDNMKLEHLAIDIATPVALDRQAKSVVKR